ncbi:hypothetical protein EIP86_009600 [Pleurotus ostreatoroseus]|nr:hypothetical protein EIP86_009600 [Pleurotus ostreatoroseus]
MGDSKTKEGPASEKDQSKGVGIPLPVAAPTSAKTARRQRLRRIFKWLLVFSVVYLIVLRWAQILKPQVEEEAERWLANPFAAPWERWGRGRFGHEHGHGHGRPGRGHKVLNGKPAEDIFLTIPNPVSAISASRRFATTPHMAGTPGDFQTAKDFLSVLQSELGVPVPDDEPIFSAGTKESREATLGIPKLKNPTAWIDVYYPVMNTPLNHSVEIIGDDGLAVWSAQLEEVADFTDPEAGRYADAVQAFHGLSKSGEVKGKLVYANYGTQEDYKALVDKGVNLNGTIVLVRYGGIFRGLKVKGAEELGAVGVLIYSDPVDDGAVTEDNGYLPYPYGPARNPSSIQRGSVQYLSMYPGDPTTPGYPAYENSTRTEGENIPSIPSLPLSWANAQILLQEISGDGLNRTISFVNHVDTRVIPIWNTMGVIPGHIQDEVVIIGNHRDGWKVMGATDPTSGTASINEVIRGFGALLAQGWKPLRTVVFASWDAEEYGLIGSTEWGEDFKTFIDKHVVAYINLDGSTSGSRFHAMASPSLAHMIRSTAERVPHPTKLGLTLWDATNDDGPLDGNVSAEVQAMYEEQFKLADDLGVSPLGSGSDFTVFLQHIGIASSNVGFGSTPHDPVYHYHSVYDSERWQEVYNDPGFFQHVAIAQQVGLQALRIADSIIIPVNTTHYTSQLQSYLDDVEAIAATSTLDVKFHSLRHELHHLHKASIALDKEKAHAEADLKRIIKKLARRHVIRRKIRRTLCKVGSVFGRSCHRRFQPNELERGQDRPIPPFQDGNGHVHRPRIGRAPVWLEEQRARHGCHVHGLSHGHHGKKHEVPKKLKKAIERVQRVNKKLVTFEKGFISEEGIKDREWYKHLGVAPGKWLGYGATTFPALTESFTIEHNETMAKHEVKRLSKLVKKLAKKIEP